MLAWNQAINLTAIREPEAVARLHVLDSLAAVAVLRGLDATRLLDLGSGGGFPGLTLAIALGCRALLVDSVGKKARFLETAARAIDLDGVTVAAARAESLATDPAHRARWPVVTARAVATLAELVELALPLLVVGGSLVAWKRGALDDELEAGERAARVMGGEPPRVIDAAPKLLPGHRLVVVRKRSDTAPTWPREVSARRRRPW